MCRSALLSLLVNYTPTPGTESEMHDATIRFVERHVDCFERSLAVGHITASGWVVSPDRSQVLLMHHRKLDRWFQPGGHCDGDPDTAAVAKKEVMEETGIKNPFLISDEIYDVDVHLIPASSKDAAHYHYDIRFLFEADPNDALIINKESKDVKWVSVQEVATLNDSESIVRMVRKLRATGN
jgi:8-oxo-dGTP pyrophosphatase MutT (NUDIX family)